MARSPDFEINRAEALMLAEAFDQLELAQVLVCPEPAPVQSAAEQAHARAVFGVIEAFDLPLDHPGNGSRETRH